MTIQGFALNVVASALLIAAAVWLGERRPGLAGFLVSLPLNTMLVLAFSRLQHHDAGKTFLLAKSIFLGVPLSLTFFLPFLLAGRLHLSFWQAYLLGIGLVAGAYFAHRFLFRLLSS